MQVASGELSLREVVERLSSDDFEEREAATRLLADVPAWDDQVLSLVSAQKELSAEAKARIREALFSRFANSPGPAVGIQMQLNRSEPGVAVQSVIPNFPAARSLRADDVIFKIDDQDLRSDPTTLRLQEVIASYQPGDRVQMLILRDGREQTVTVELGRFADLNNGIGNRNESLLRQAWALRARRLGLEEAPGEPIAAAVSFFDWRRAAQRGAAPRHASGMVAGGESALVPGRLPGGVTNIDNSRVGRVERADPRIAPEPRAIDVQKALDERLTQIESLIQDLSARLSDARTPQHEHAKPRHAGGTRDAARQIILEMARWADRATDRAARSHPMTMLTRRPGTTITCTCFAGDGVAPSETRARGVRGASRPRRAGP